MRIAALFILLSLLAPRVLIAGCGGLKGEDLAVCEAATSLMAANHYQVAQGPSEANPAWYDCEDDGQCVFVAAHCEGSAVNQASVKSHAGWIWSNSRHMSPECLSKIDQMQYTMLPVCVQKKCQLQPKGNV